MRMPTLVAIQRTVVRHSMRGTLSLGEHRARSMSAYGLQMYGWSRCARGRKTSCMTCVVSFSQAERAHVRTESCGSTARRSS